MRPHIRFSCGAFSRPAARALMASSGAEWEEFKGFLRSSFVAYGSDDQLSYIHSQIVEWQKQAGEK